MRGGGGTVRGLSQWVQLCMHIAQCTWSPNKLWRSNSIFNLWFTQRQIDRINMVFWPYFCNKCSFVAHVHFCAVCVSVNYGVSHLCESALPYLPVCSIYVEIWIPLWICWCMIRMTVVVYVVYCLTYLKENNKYLKKLWYLWWKVIIRSTIFLACEFVYIQTHAVNHT